MNLRCGENESMDATRTMPPATGGDDPGPPAYRLGLPAWAFPAWRGRFFDPAESPLAGYARVFNSVEGNTSFYRVPAAATVRSWVEAVAGRDFRFCFKLPRSVTHEHRPDLQELTALFRVLEPLGLCLGPFLVQFPARLGPREFDALTALLDGLPVTHRYVVEVRHPEFFSAPERLDAALAERGMGRVCLDARPLHRGDVSHPEVAAARHEKPDLPVHPRALGNTAFVRLVLHPDGTGNGPWLEEWASRTARWITQGVDTWLMVHCPNNLHCPTQARNFHQHLRARPETGRLPPLAPWTVPQQRSLL